MTVTKLQKLWPYFLLATIILVVFPLITGLFAVIIDMVFYPNGNHAFDYMRAKVVWALSLVFYTWPFVFLVLFPYSLVYLGTSLKGRHVIYQMLLFYALMTLAGVVAPEASVIESFKPHPYPEVWIMYFLLTIIFCPLCNIALDRMAKNLSYS